MIVLVELNDLIHGLFHRVAELEEGEIFVRDVAEVEHVIPNELHPGFPIPAVRLIEQDHRNDARLASLDERQHLKTFIHRAEAPGKESERECLLHQVQFAGEEVIEVYELAVAIDNRVSPLFEREPNVEAEAIFPASPRCAAPMIPSPPPVMTMKLCLMISRLNCSAIANGIASTGVRAKPKTAIFRICV